MPRKLPFAVPAPARAARTAQLASLAAGLTYAVIDTAIGPPLDIAVKGSCVTLLALAAVLLPAPGRLWLAAILAAEAVGDVLIELPGGFLVGALAFAIGHVIAIGFHLRNRRTARPVDRLLAAGLVLFGLVMPQLVSPPGMPVGLTMVYSVLLCGMAAAVLLGRFSHVALAGALLFVLSDTLLVMRLGGRSLGSPAIHGVVIWLSYYLGQALIFAGVAAGLMRSGAR